jgi:hypothetical protein
MATDRAAQDKKMASHLKARGIERTQQRCALCYRIVTCEGPKTSYTHICRGGRGG